MNETEKDESQNLHPDFQQEVERLRYTIHYMEDILEQSQTNIQAAQSKIHEALSNVEYLDSSDSYINILTNSRFFELARTQKESLEAVIKKPYFARIHFQRTGAEEEYLYIGKTSLFHNTTLEPIIVDWRSPVANVYYEGRLGDVTYNVRGEQLSGHLFSKRQFKIDNGELLTFHDVDLTTNDDLLQEALYGKADVRLTEIVETIQQEQNEIIRAHLRQPILVQGAAGSGKTTIALHRISYFLYTLGENFKPEQLMILAPNNLFIDYIEDVLPELGVERICQTTFTEYVQKATGIKLKLQNPNDYLEEMIESESSELPSFNIAQIKGSLLYRDILDRYMERHEQQLAQAFDEDVYIEKYKIMRGSHLKKLFLIEFSYMPIEKRLERIKKVVQAEVRRKSKTVLASVNARYEEIIGKALNGFRDPEQRKRNVTKFIDERDERLPKIKEAARTAASSYLKRFEKVKIKAIYRKFLTDPLLIRELAPEWSLEEQEQFIQAHRKEKWLVEDLAALYYLHAKIKGIKDEWKMRVVFIDEVQDYSLFQLAALKAGLETDMFTMVGDLAQGIHSYRSITEWEPVLQLFPRANFFTLQKSYRTTVEIMHVANHILSKINEQLPLVEPVVRHGNPPTFIRSEVFNSEEIKGIYEQLKRDGHRSIALICKTSVDAAAYAEILQDADVECELLSEDSALVGSHLLIVPSHLAKGLEFDAVIVVAYDLPYYDTSIDRKLLYVALTRAMHELYLVGRNKLAFLLEDCDEPLLNEKKLFE